MENKGKTSIYQPEWIFTEMMIFILSFEWWFILDWIKREMASFSQQINDENALKQECAPLPSLKLVGGSKVVKTKFRRIYHTISRILNFEQNWFDLIVLNWIALNWSELFKVYGLYGWENKMLNCYYLQIKYRRQLANLQAKSLGL